MSVFRESLVFFDKIGLYDVILPFLLIFTLVFAVLEKSKIFGTEKSSTGEVAAKKNLNAMVAFIAGFFVVASAQLVELINVLVSRVALILVILVMLMLLLASFHEQQGDEGFSLSGAMKGWLTGVILVAVVLIFLDGVGWLGPAWLYATQQWDSTFMSTLILFALVIGFIAWLTSSPKQKGDKAKAE